MAAIFEVNNGGIVPTVETSSRVFGLDKNGQLSADLDAPIMVYVAVYDKRNGHIKMVINCLNTNMHLQHEVWGPDFDYVEVEKGCDPKEHIIDVVSKAVAPRAEVTISEIGLKEQEVFKKAEAELKQFTSTATGQELIYLAADPLIMAMAAFDGGPMETDQGIVEHTKEQARQVVKDFLVHRQAVAAQRDAKVEDVLIAQTKDDLAAIDTVIPVAAENVFGYDRLLQNPKVTP